MKTIFSLLVLALVAGQVHAQSTRAQLNNIRTAAPVSIFHEFNQDDQQTLRTLDSQIQLEQKKLLFHKANGEIKLVEAASIKLRALKTQRADLLRKD